MNNLYRKDVTLTRTQNRARDDQSNALIQTLASWCCTQPLHLCVLFGSQAAGRTHPMSDVDLAVWPAEPPTPSQKLAWLVALQNLLDKDVSLVLVSPDLDTVLGMEIVRHGQLVYEAQPELWYSKRLDLWHAYNDAMPFLRAQRQDLLNFAKEVKHGP